MISSADYNSALLPDFVHGHFLTPVTSVTPVTSITPVTSVTSVSTPKWVPHIGPIWPTWYPDLYLMIPIFGSHGTEICTTSYPYLYLMLPRFGPHATQICTTSYPDLYPMLPRFGPHGTEICTTSYPDLYPRLPRFGPHIAWIPVLVSTIFYAFLRYEWVTCTLTSLTCLAASVILEYPKCSLSFSFFIQQKKNSSGLPQGGQPGNSHLLYAENESLNFSGH